MHSPTDRHRISQRRVQSGAALLLMMLVVLVAATAILVSRLDRGTLHTRQINETQQALAKAKQALIDHALTQADLNAGAALTLPCPDLDAGGATLNGESHTANCGATGVTVLGRFPWRTLATPAYTDSSGECLWYAVSGSYKNAGPATGRMINPDTNGQLQLYSLESGDLIEGVLAEDRPVAMLFAPLSSLPAQLRPGSGISGNDCSDNFSVSDYLDADLGSGISNALVSGNPDAIERFIVSVSGTGAHNDRVLSIRRSELANAVYRRPDFADSMNDLTRAITGCVAAWGMSNATPDDRRLPWPASVSLADYRLDASYDDDAGGVLSGRLANVVDDSSGVTANAVTEILGGCDPSTVPEWNAARWASWQNWKDHFFYAVAESFAPGATIPTSCGTCFSVNGIGAYAAIILFSGERLQALGQRRNAPPLDSDTKGQIANYLEGRNLGAHPYASGSADFETRAADSSFNDVAYCIDAAMTVTSC
ncbi:MAG: hypothetical protein OEW68_00445 [Gammaproteobacteria bacterium]|nr:hypothetical protein [Gammaproteobacteria bacterium]MDH4313292.1 hypothetical protein [Gammaproteobacteria bacterium]MDH5212907.1 hypothetical protein [Gammaproteobacteria bacterium]